jgi:hypothetical protein
MKKLRHLCRPTKLFTFNPQNRVYILDSINRFTFLLSHQ